MSAAKTKRRRRENAAATPEAKPAEDDRSDWYCPSQKEKCLGFNKYSCACLAWNDPF